MNTWYNGGGGNQVVWKKRPRKKVKSIPLHHFEISLVCAQHYCVSVFKLLLRILFSNALESHVVVCVAINSIMNWVNRFKCWWPAKWENQEGASHPGGFWSIAPDSKDVAPTVPVVKKKNKSAYTQHVCACCTTRSVLVRVGGDGFIHQVISWWM